MLCITLLLKYKGGNIIFQHKRVGYHKKYFYCYKFRTMVINADDVLTEHLRQDKFAQDEWRKNFKLRNDPRVTKFGEFLRKTSLDELPQLFNVLKGDMSLVGPRPIVQDEIQYYGDAINHYYAMKPGLTGVWQVNGRSSTSYEQRIQYDIWYFHHQSIYIDFKILLKTVFVVLFRVGAV